METWHIVVTGLVQGVGYRAACAGQATSLGLGGWVRNRQDGSVEVMAYGAPEQLEALCAWMRRGPPGARVSTLQAGPGEGEFDGFGWLPTV
ncbi:acylphosphatase [Cupriavidus basilensis]|uniref:acylphosphatase n=1 Tax=Cupriavidus basilensis TaxID=68895 RepID=A0ABT6AGJ6_9BURK|nr:acylphosphatase [Cupriavidus basilensis]MDF3831722.1 acylphosphatase [Cupriavidus basilensis]